MAKINLNGQTVSENSAKKNSAKKTSNAITGLMNTLSDSMSPETKQNAQTIASIISMI